MSEVTDLLKVSQLAAEAAAEFLKERHLAIFKDGSEELKVSTKSKPTDFVTEVDKQTQDLIISIIQEHYPEHRFIAEEDGAESLGNPDSPYEWIIDPLDGTTNFIHGKPNFGTIVAVQKDGELLAGTMILPMLDRYFTGGKGIAGTVNGRPIKLRQTANFSDAILCCNLSSRALVDEQGVKRVALPNCASVENYGNAVEELGEVLLGHNDGAFFRYIKIWDIAVGFLLIKEAGGDYRYEFIEEDDHRQGLVAATSTKPIFKDLCEFVFDKGVV